MSFKKLTRREQRKKRIRKKILGTSERPRLTVFRSQKHIYVQIVDDSSGKTLVSASTLEKGNRLVGSTKANAGIIGKRVGEKAKAAKIKEVVFDRNGYLYHGIVKTLAEAARETGLRF